MFRDLMKKLGAWTTLQSWNEPLFLRSRLRGDVWFRGGVAWGIGAAFAALMLFLFAVNHKPPHLLHAGWGILLGGGLAGLYLYRGKSTAGGRVRICEEGIIRRRQYMGIMHQVNEEASWRHEHIQALAIVPPESLGKSFGLLLIAAGNELDLIGIPARVNLQQLTAELTARGHSIQVAHEIPESLRKPFPWPVGLVAALLGCGALLFGLTIYVVSSWGRPAAGGVRMGRADSSEIRAWRSETRWF